MKNDTLVKINLFLNKNKTLKNTVVFIDKASPLAVMIIFYCSLAFLMLSLDIRALFFAAIPWGTFFIVTLIRKKLNHKRPFEELEIEPLSPHSKGKACPSRHASSSAVISAAMYYLYPPLGIATSFLCIIICISRVLTGVHYPKDVISGAVIGGLLGYAGFFILL